MGIPLLEADSLTIRRSLREVVHELSFRFDSGVLGIMGPNGAGKSTLLRVLGEGARIRSGRLVLGGVPLGTGAGLAKVRGSVGYQAQRPSVIPHFSVVENIRYAAWLKGVPSGRDDPAVRESLDTVHLSDKSGHHARRLSGGEIKRLAIAMAIVHRPALLVLDEPTAALDPDEHESMLSVIKGLSTSSSVLFTSHDPADIAGACNEVLVIAEGTKRFHGSLDDLTDFGRITVVEGYRAAVSS